MSVSMVEVEELWSMDDYQNAQDAMDVWDELESKATRTPAS